MNEISDAKFKIARRDLVNQPKEFNYHLIMLHISRGIQWTREKVFEIEVDWQSLLEIQSF